MAVRDYVRFGGAFVQQQSGDREPISLPDKASIAALPFGDMPESQDDEYLADGIAEDIITLLARIPSFFVNSRTSTISYRGKQRDIREIGRELGVRYLVEGSLRPIGDRVRVTIQLIDVKVVLICGLGASIVLRLASSR